MINANGYKLTKSSSHDKIKVAIIDSGIDYSSDIDVCERKNFIPNQDDRSILYEDGSGHGTAVAGIIAAKRNDIGITGVNENVSLYSAKVLDENNQAPVSRVIQAIEWAIQKKVNIINLSLGMSQYSKALHDVIKRAVDENILIIAAVGNGTDIEYPAAFEETIAVGSIDANGQLSNRSATGDKVDVVAPGEQILSTSAFEGIMASSGTSMAVPHVTGIASILWQKNKNVSAEFIRKLICESAKNIGDKNYYGSGIIDLEYAINNYEDALQEYQKRLAICGPKIDIDIVRNDNSEDILCFDNVEIIEGRWNQNDHKNLGNKANSIAGGLSSAELTIVKKGIVAQDNYLVYKANDSKTKKYEVFHGYSNYINAYEYLMEMALKCKTGGLDAAKKISYPNSNKTDNAECTNIKSAITKTLITKVLGSTSYNKKNAALVLMGMSMHIVSDTYAHRAYVPGTPYWTHITHDTGADNATNKIGEKRYKAAGYAVGEVLSIWNGNCPPSFEEFDLIGIFNHSASFRLINYNAYSSRCWNGIDYNYYSKNIKKLSCKFVSDGKGLPE